MPAVRHLGESTRTAVGISGSGALGAVVYAPNAEVAINGNGDVMGAIVANKVSLTGAAAFHYDEALTAYYDHQPFAIARWRELTTAAARARWESVFHRWQ
jgi:hypothetical protein